MTLHEPTWDEARAAAHAAATPLEPRSIGIVEARGLTLAQPLVALSQVPAFNTSMMDGWAVAGSGPWRVVGRVLAGTAPSPIEPGTAVVIATGAPVPDGTTGVLRREWGAVEAEVLTTDRHVEQGMDIRFAGDEANVGDHLLPAGSVVTPPVVGLAALVGVDDLQVHRAAAVEVLVMGDEIITHGIPSIGKVRDALGVQVLAWTQGFNCTQIGVRYVEDTLEATVAAIASSTADVIFTTGGTARGPVDHMHDALAAVGAELIVDEVKVRPGHPMLLAALGDNRFLIGLPGNPLAAITGFITLGAPVLTAMAGRVLDATESVTTSDAISAPSSDRRIIPAKRVGMRATPTEFWGSAMLRGIADSDCVLVTDAGGADAESRVGVLPLPW